MGDAIIDMSRGLGIESIDRGEPKLLYDGGRPFVGMVDPHECMTGYDPTIEDVMKVHSEVDGAELHGMSATDLYSRSVEINNAFVRHGERDLRLISQVLGQTIGQATERTIGRNHQDIQAGRVRNR